MIVAWLGVSAIFTTSCKPPETSAPIFNRKAESESGNLVNLNTADTTELRKLPGVGEKTALKIIDFRERHGPFSRVEHLILIDGISEKKFSEIAPFTEVR